MKNTVPVLLFIFAFNTCIGQDIVTTKNDQQLNVVVVEQTNKYLKYKMPDYTEGPVLWIRLNKISKIEYKNGHTDLLGNQNPRKNKPIGITLGGAFAPVGRSGFFDATLDYFLTPQIDLEANFGTSDIRTYGMYFSAGTRIHISSKYSERKLTPFTGALVGSNYGDGFFQVPLGVNWIAESGLHGSLSLNEMIGFNSWLVTFIELRAGWRFKL